MSNDNFPQSPGSADDPFTQQNPSPYDPNQPGGYHSGSLDPGGNNPGGRNSNNASPKKTGLGCWFWGCLGTLTFTLLAMVAMGFATYWYLSKQVTKFTDNQPAEIPVVELDEAEMQALQTRLETFTNQVTGEDSETNELTPANSDAEPDAITEAANNPSDSEEPGSQPEPQEADSDESPQAEPVPQIKELVLTANEINALINSEEELRKRVFVRIEDGRLFGTISIPTDMVPGGSGRYLNADGEFDVSMKDGILVVRLVDASVKGERIPDEILEGFSQGNLAKDAYKDTKNAEILRKFESIEVKDDSIILKLKTPESDQ
ncbi:hypothetical protein [Neorhodopirellula lusitana]|uniref:hypothetical protein n=1 Tax=Neorhodopirellula lusitana TaxID=445327 RepID=UPI00384E2D3D